MCFSAQASFVASALLGAVWIACLLKASKQSHVLLSLIPFFFAVQQFAEGILWVLLPKGGPPGIIHLATYIFLIIAAFGWPLLIPLAGRAMETNPQRKNLLTFFVMTALIWALVGGYYLLMYGVTATISSGHILYTMHSQFLTTPFHTIYYCGAVLIPFFIASNPLFNFLGILTTLSCIAAYFLWYVHFLSVWCFFAALISAGTYSVLIAEQRRLKA